LNSYKEFEKHKKNQIDLLSKQLDLEDKESKSRWLAIKPPE
jgi:hypothetical protein